MIAKNKYFKPLTFSVIATAAIGLLALGLMFSAGALAWSLDPTTPLYPRIGSILALIALVLVFWCHSIWGALDNRSGKVN